jgi:hypothetical protein
MWFRFVGLILFVLRLVAQTPQDQFAVVSDIQYCTGGESPLLIDIFIPKHRNRNADASRRERVYGAWHHREEGVAGRTPWF